LFRRPKLTLGCSAEGKKKANVTFFLGLINSFHAKNRTSQSEEPTPLLWIYSVCEKFIIKICSALSQPLKAKYS
jgi:hypothetical protein